MRSELLIGGEWRQGSEDGRIVVLDPATDEQVAEVADGTPADALAACDAAEAAQATWAVTAPRERSEILRNCWKVMIDHTDELASLIVREHGKPMADAKGEIAYSAEFFRWNAEETVRIRGELGTAPGGANKIIVHHPPVGVVFVKIKSGCNCQKMNSELPMTTSAVTIRSTTSDRWVPDPLQSAIVIDAFSHLLGAMWWSVRFGSGEFAQDASEVDLSVDGFPLAHVAM